MFIIDIIKFTINIKGDIIFVIKMPEINNDELRRKILKIYYDEYFKTKLGTLSMKEVNRIIGIEPNKLSGNISYLSSKNLIRRPKEPGLMGLIRDYYWITSKGIDFIENKKSFSSNDSEKDDTKALDLPSNEQVKIFIGHGRTNDWRDLKDHLQDKHKYEVIAYEVGSRAGFSIKEVLEKMLTESSFALLVFTPEDEDKAGGFHARENVIHELGLFQAKLGFNRAIAIISSKVDEFSNIHGITQIRYSEGNIKETYGEILATIKREFPE